MKELYISPEANIIAFAPTERLANWAEDVINEEVGLDPNGGAVISKQEDVIVGGDVDTNIFD